MTGNLFAGVALATSVGFAVMFVMIMLHLPQLVISLGLVAGIFITLVLIGGNTTYLLTNKGVERVVKPIALRSFGISHKQFFSLDKIKWYSTGSDMNRSYKEYDYLIIKFSGAGQKWKITGPMDEDSDFKTFLETFIKISEAYNLSMQPISGRMASKPEVRTHHSSIKRKKAFYETMFAKAFTLFLLVLLAAVLVFYFYNPHYLKLANIWRIMAIIVPGTLYMVYRTFIGKS